MDSIDCPMLWTYSHLPVVIGLYHQQTDEYLYMVCILDGPCMGQGLPKARTLLMVGLGKSEGYL